MTHEFRSVEARSAVLSLRATLGTLAAFACSWALIPTLGLYHRTVLYWLLFAILAAVGACLCREREWRLAPAVGKGLILGAVLVLALWYEYRGPHNHKLYDALIAVPAFVVTAASYGRLRALSPSASLLGAVAMLLSGRALLACDTAYGEGEWAMEVLRWSAVGGFVAITALLRDLDDPTGQKRGFRLRVTLVFVTGTLLHVSAVVSSPDPVNDVYAWHRDATDYLLHGQNPYSAPYQSPYTTERARQFGQYAPSATEHPAVYPPVPLLLMLPFRAVHLDIRYANVLAMLAAAWVLFVTGARRGQAVAGAFAAGLFLHLPRSPLMIELSCGESLLAALLGGGMLLADQRKHSGYLLLGLGLTGKQFGVAMLAPLTKAVSARWRSLALGLTPAACVILAFFAWDPEAFFSTVFLKHATEAQSYLTTTLFSAVHDFVDLDLPRAVQLGVAAALIGLITWRNPVRGVAGSLGMGAGLLIFCFCYTKCHFNYLFLCAYLLLLGAVAALPMVKHSEMQVDASR